jgi:hypothetical protein
VVVHAASVHSPIDKQALMSVVTVLLIRPARDVFVMPWRRHSTRRGCGSPLG